MSKPRPRVLQPGDTIGIFALSSPHQKDKRLRGARVLADLGFKVRPAPGIGRKSGYLAGDDEIRARGFNELAADPDVRALLAVRGGYGCQRVVQMLRLDALRSDPKPVIGCSDLTFLHMVLQKEVGPVCVHGPMLATEQMAVLGKTPWLREMLLQLLTENKPLGLCRPQRSKLIREGEATGRLTGGNATMLVHALAAGVAKAADFNGRILFLEDVNEEGYRLDRLFATLRQAGIFERIAGLVVGEFSGKAGWSRVNGLAEWALGKRHIPVMSWFPVGHGRINVPLPLGVRARLDSRGLAMVQAFARK